MARPQKSTLIAAGGIVFTILAYFISQVSMLLMKPEWSIDRFRDYYAGDQLSYLAMVVNGSNGDFRALEPFTQSGANNYPHLWYTVLGWFSHVTGLSPVASWTVCGLFMQCLLVVGVSVACLIITRRAWTTFAGIVPLGIGTFSWLISGSWQTQMDNHAVLWGGFAVLFTLNGEAAALCIAGLALLALVTGASRTLSRRSWLILGVLVGLAVGVLANVQTYSFLTVAYLAAFGLAAYALAVRPKRWLIALSAVLVVLLFILGPFVAPGLGQLITLTIGLAPAVPGLVLLLIRTKGLLLIPAGTALLAAAPQVLGTYLALKAGDPFLNYRVASSKDLGVFVNLGILCAVALLVPLILVLIAGIVRKNALWASYPIATVVAWAILAGNDRWGANQEPYRFWIDCFLLTAVTLVPIALHVGITLWKPQDEAVPARFTRVVRVVAVVAIVVVAASAIDWAWFYRNTRATGLWSFTGPFDSALQAATVDAGDGIILPDPCINPLYLKPSSGARVAYFNLGMAWPDDRTALQNVLQQRSLNVLDSPQALAATDITLVLTTSDCSEDWPTLYADRLTKVAAVDWENEGEGTVTLWKVDAN